MLIRLMHGKHTPRLIALGSLLLIGAAMSGCSKVDGSGIVAAAEVDYWTCGMHPGIQVKRSGKCPICGMDLVPIAKGGAGVSPSAEYQRRTDNNDSGNHLLPGMQQANESTQGARAAMESKAGEFTVPIERQQQIGVTYTEVKKRSLRAYVRSVGTLEPDHTKRFEYVARADGYIREVKVASPGDRVAAGEPLMSIYSPDVRAREQELVAVLNQRENAANNGSSLFDQFIEATKHRLMLLNVGEKEIAAIEQTHQVSDELILRSPFDGVVEYVPVRTGMTVRSDDRLIGLLDLSQLWLWAEFYEDEVDFLKAGQTVHISLPACPNETFEGQIKVVSPAIDPARRTVKARIDVPNTGHRLRPGMYANVQTEVDAGAGLTVPVNAVLPTGSRMLVFVAKNGGKLEPRFIRVASPSPFSDLGDGVQGRYYQVTAGLKEGERVVASANFLIDAESQLQGAINDWGEGEANALGSTR